MKFLVITDLHGNLAVLDKMDKQFAEADAVLFAGDFSKYACPETGLPALEKLCKKHDTIFFFCHRKNCDEPSFSCLKIEDKGYFPACKGRHGFSMKGFVFCRKPVAEQNLNGSTPNEA